MEKLEKQSNENRNSKTPLDSVTQLLLIELGLGISIPYITYCISQPEVRERFYSLAEYISKIMF